MDLNRLKLFTLQKADLRVNFVLQGGEQHLGHALRLQLGHGAASLIHHNHWGELPTLEPGPERLVRNEPLQSHHWTLGSTTQHGVPVHVSGLADVRQGKVEKRSAVQHHAPCRGVLFPGSPKYVNQLVASYFQRFVDWIHCWKVVES